MDVWQISKLIELAEDYRDKVLSREITGFGQTAHEEASDVNVILLRLREMREKASHV